MSYQVSNCTHLTSHWYTQSNTSSFKFTAMMLEKKNLNLIAAFLRAKRVEMRFVLRQEKGNVTIS